MNILHQTFDRLLSKIICFSLSLSRSFFKGIFPIDIYFLVIQWIINSAFDIFIENLLFVNDRTMNDHSSGSPISVWNNVFSSNETPSPIRITKKPLAFVQPVIRDLSLSSSPPYSYVQQSKVLSIHRRMDLTNSSM